MEVSANTDGHRFATLQDRLADAITVYCGSMTFVYIHALLFAVWIGTQGFGHDAFPSNFLTMVVSLEAIFLSTFVLISQNRQQAAADAQARVMRDALMKTLQDVVADEKLDQKNEAMIQQLLREIDVERFQPLFDRQDQIAPRLAHIEESLARGGSYNESS
jgi:uncharacterized membrane protein